MMRKTVLTASALLALTATAHADVRYDAEYELTKLATQAADVEYKGSAWDYYDDRPNACRDTLAELTKKGMKPTDEVRDKVFLVVPGAVAGVREENGKGVLTFSKASLICDRWESVNKLAIAYDELAKKHYPYMWRNETPEELATLAGTDDPATWDKLIAQAKQCAADVDALLQSGISPDARVEQANGKTSLPEYKVKICDSTREFAERMKVEMVALMKKKAEAVEGKFKKVGIKGKRLELFAYYDMEWYLPGCKSSTDDPKKLKKAKKLFQWLTASDGQITIRKYTFKGDNYTTSEKTTYSETQAYKLCR